MRLLSFDKDGAPAIGIGRADGGTVDLSVAAPDLPRDMAALLAGGAAALAAAARAAEGAGTDAVLAGEIDYLPPVPRPGKIVCVGLNYRDHAAETDRPPPEFPVLFARFATTLVGHRHPLRLPRLSDQFDYEGELVAVIGKPGRHIAEADALDHVAGYSIFNEGSVRDYQTGRGPQWTLGKNFDASGGFGPHIVTADELPPGAAGLRLRTRLNGAVMQDATTDQMIFPIPRVIAAITEAMSLAPGDLIVTGTPAGVGFARTPPVFLRAGDVCEIEIEGIGTLVNPVAAEE